LRAGYPVAYAAGDEIPERADESASVSASVEALLAIAELYEKMETLAPRIREAMCFFHGVFGHPRLNQPQIAGLTGVTVPTVSRRCKKGMAELRQLYGVPVA
jgi:DNA-directed RNA polymerase specialized sigma subunit